MCVGGGGGGGAPGGLDSGNNTGMAIARLGSIILWYISHTTTSLASTSYSCFFNLLRLLIAFYQKRCIKKIDISPSVFGPI